MFAMDAGQLTGVVGRQSSCYRVAATRTRDVLHVTCTVELPLLLDSSSHLPTEGTLLHVMQVLDGFLNHGVVWMTVSRADTVEGRMQRPPIKTFDGLPFVNDLYFYRQMKTIVVHLVRDLMFRSSGGLYGAFGSADLLTVGWRTRSGVGDCPLGWGARRVAGAVLVGAVKYRWCCTEKQYGVGIAFGVAYIGKFLSHLLLKPLFGFRAKSSQQVANRILANYGEGHTTRLAALSESRCEKK